MRKRKHPKQNKPIDMSDYKQPSMAELLGDGSEPITDLLMVELSSQGIKAKDVCWFRDNGYRYNRQRKSFFAPPEFEGEMFDSNIFHPERR